jgi:beta-glucuronidase
MEFKADPGNSGLGKRWQVPGKAKGWRSVRIPHIISRRITGKYPGGTVGWYRLRFRAPSGANDAFRADFEQVRRQSTFWLNGRRLERNPDPYSPFGVPLRGVRRGVNQLIVRVDYRKGRNPIEGWWNWGGIVRPVSVASVGRLSASSFNVAGNLPCFDAQCGGQLVGQTYLQNRSRRTIADPALQLTLRSPAGETQTQVVRTTPLGPNRRRLVKFSLPVGAVQTWSPENPVLYTVTATTLAGGQPQEVKQDQTGFRSIVVDNGRLKLNGRPLNMRGISMHEDVPGRGPALRNSDIDGIVRQVRAVGADVVRSHYALDERLLDAFDRNGILVYNQAPVYQRSTQLQSRARRYQALHEVRGSVEQGYSHPSVIVNTVANELAPGADTNPGVKAYLDRANAMVQTLDPTRPVGVDLRSLPGYGPQNTYKQFDVLGFNEYFGWYRGQPGRSIESFQELRGFLRQQREIYPQQALVVSEFGAEATQSGSDGVKGTYEFQNNYLAGNLDVIDQETYVSGAIYWTLREFVFRPRWAGGSSFPAHDAIHNKGLISYRGNRPKPAFFTARSRFLATPLYGEDQPAPPPEG